MTESSNPNEQWLSKAEAKYMSVQTSLACPCVLLILFRHGHDPSIASLLACNQELVQAFTAYNQMMERQHLSKVTKASQNDIPVTQPTDTKPNQDLISFGDGAGVGVGQGIGNGFGDSNGHSNGNHNGKYTNGGPVSNGKGSTPAASQPTKDPFADEPYYVAGAAEVATAVKMG